MEHLGFPLSSHRQEKETTEEFKGEARKACNACVKRCGIIVLQNDPLRTVPQPENKITRFKLGWGYFDILTCSYPSSTSDTSKKHTAGDCCRSNLTVCSPQL